MAEPKITRQQVLKGAAAAGVLGPLVLRLPHWPTTVAMDESAGTSSTSLRPA